MKRYRIRTGSIAWWAAIVGQALVGATFFGVIYLTVWVLANI